MDKIIVTDPLYLKCKRMVETCNKNQTEMAKNYLKLALKKFDKKKISNSVELAIYQLETTRMFIPLFEKLVLIGIR
jgi:hypothetical protein